MRSYGVVGKAVVQVLAVYVLAAAAVSPAQAGYTVRDLTPAGYDGAYLYGASGSQQVGYGYLTVDAVQYPAAMVWSGDASTYVNLNPAGFTDSWAYGTDGTYQVGYGLTSSDNPTEHALVWAGTAASVLDLNPPTSNLSYAIGIGGGQIVGTARPGIYEHAALWTSGTADSYVDLHPAGYQSSALRCTNGTQQFGEAMTSAGIFHAFEWSGNAASAVDITPSGVTYANVYAVCGNQKVGVGDNHALLWSGPANTVTDLNPSGYRTTYAYGVSDTLQVGYGIPTTGGNSHALVWAGTAASVIDLSAYLPAGLTGSVAEAVDSSGRISGYAIDQVTYARHAILWLPTAADTNLSTSPSVSGRIGQKVTLSGTLTLASGGTPISGETLRFEVDGAPVGTGVTGSDGAATLRYTIPEGSGTGPRAIGVFHDETSDYGASSATGTLHVSKGTPGFSLYAAIGSIGQTVNLRTLFLCGGQPITGRTVQFAVDGSPVGSAVSDASGAVLPWRIPVGAAAGAHEVTVSFAGDADYTAGLRTTAALWVKPKVAFSLFAANGVAGHSVVLRTLVYGAGKPLVGLPVQFAVDGTPIGTAISDATGASISYAIPAAMATGPHAVTVSFAGNTLYNASTRTTPALTVKAAVLFSLSAASGTAGATVQLKTLVYSGGAPVSGLLIKFAVDGVPAGMATSNASGAVVSYVIPASMAAGTHDVTVSFAGDSTYNAATRTTAALTVK